MGLASGSLVRQGQHFPGNERDPLGLSMAAGQGSHRDDLAVRPDLGEHGLARGDDEVVPRVGVPLDAAGVEGVSANPVRQRPDGDQERGALGQRPVLQRPAMDPDEAVRCGVLAEQQERPVARLEREPLDVAVAAYPGSVRVVEDSLPIGALEALIEPAGAGREVEAIADDRQALEVVADGCLAEREGLDEAPAAVIDLVDDAVLVAVPEEAPSSAASPDISFSRSGSRQRVVVSSENV